MIVLALDTALDGCSVALTVDHDVVIVKHEQRERGHAEVLLPMVEAVLAEAGKPLDAVDGYAVTVGPGSFTGVRIAIAAVRGFLIAHRRLVFAASSLEAIAAPFLAAGGTTPLLALVDARRDHFYAQAFMPGGSPLPARLEDLAQPALVAAERVVSRDLADTRLVGPGAGLVDPACGWRPGRSGAIDSANLAALALAAPRARWQASVSPLYLRPPDAVRPAPSPFAATAGPSAA